MKKKFVIELGHDEATGIYRANVVSVEENKGVTIESHSLKAVLAEVSKSVRKRERKNTLFPPPEPPRILSLNGHNGDVGPRVIVPGS